MRETALPIRSALYVCRAAALPLDRSQGSCASGPESPRPREHRLCCAQSPYQQGQQMGQRDVVALLLPSAAKRLSVTSV
jgi:hypothetical protein